MPLRFITAQASGLMRSMRCSRELPRSGSLWTAALDDSHRTALVASRAARLSRLVLFMVLRCEVGKDNDQDGWLNWAAVDRTIVKKVLICSSFRPTGLSLPIQLLMAERTSESSFTYAESRRPMARLLMLSR